MFRFKTVSIPEFGLRYLALAMTALLVLPSLGCSSAQTRTARNLSSRESHKLIASRAWSVAEDKKEISAGDPTKLEAHGDRMASSGDWTAALFQYNRALALEPGADNRRLRLKVAHSYLRGKQWLQAEAAFSMLAKDQPENAVVWQGLGMSLLARKEVKQAQDAFARTLKLNPDSWVALQGMGILHNWLGEPGNAIPFFLKALQIQPKRAAIHNNLGIAHLMTGQHKKAIRNFKRALQLDPKHKLAANNLALTYANQNRLDVAQDTFERSLGAAKASNNVGVILAWKGDKEAASEKFREALKASPSHYPLAKQHLSQVDE